MEYDGVLKHQVLALTNLYCIIYAFSCLGVSLVSCSVSVPVNAKQMMLQQQDLLDNS